MEPKGPADSVEVAKPWIGHQRLEGLKNSQ